MIVGGPQPSKGIRVEGRGPTPPLARGRQVPGKGRRRFVATNCRRPAEGGASPRQPRFEFVATNLEALSRHIRTCRNPPIPETRRTGAERNVRCPARSRGSARSPFSANHGRAGISCRGAGFAEDFQLSVAWTGAKKNLKFLLACDGGL